MDILKNRGRFTWMAAAGVILAWTFFGLSSPASAQSNLVFVGSNIGSVPNMNSVFVFSNDGAGNLTQISGSPFLTGGTGWFDPTLSTSSIDADNSLIIDPTGSFLYTVNSHSNTVSVFSIAAGGALTLLSSNNTTGGSEPVSLALAPNVLSDGDSVMAVANKAQDPMREGGKSNMQTFTGDATGDLFPVIKGGHIFDPNVLASVNRTPLLPKIIFVMQLLDSSDIFTYKINPTGKLALQSSIGPPVAGDLLLGMAFHPTQHFMYVGVPNANAIAVYKYAANGTLTFQKTVTDSGLAVCWFAVNSTGTRLYSVESGSGTVSVYDITTADTPVFMQALSLKNQPQNDTNIQIDPTGNFAYVIGSATPTGQGATLLHVLNISQTDGTLSETTTPVALNVSLGEHPAGLATLIK